MGGGGLSDGRAVWQPRTGLLAALGDRTASGKTGTELNSQR